jgi:hypothetical protein
MKNLFTILLLSCIHISQAQIGELFFNKSRIKSGNDGTFFYFQYLTAAGYIVPSSDNKGTIHSASIWLSAKDSTNSDYLSAVILSDFGTDFTPGPISNDPSATADKYGRSIYEVTSKKIYNHKRDPTSNISDIYNWPANGDASMGEPAVVAPFVDLNTDNTYQPEDGEYPVMYGDKTIYNIYNDQAVQGFTGQSSMGLDIHQYIYQLDPYFDGDTLENTNFIRFIIVNRSNKDYSDFNFGVYLNIDLGNYRDDFLGTDTSSNMVYGYNGDNMDEGFAGYGLNPPMQGAMFLNTSIESSTVILQDDNPLNGLPQTNSHTINYLNGKFKNGTNKTISKGGSSFTSQYDYYGNLNSTDDYSEKDFENTPGDRNVLMVAKPAFIAAGDTLIYDLAFPYARVNFGGATGAYDSLIHLANHISNRYNSDHSWIEKAGDNRSGVSVTQRFNPTFSIYPNPSTGVFTIKGLNTDTPSIITTVSGQVVKRVEAKATSFDISDLEAGVYFLKTAVGSARLLKL